MRMRPGIARLCAWVQVGIAVFTFPVALVVGGSSLEQFSGAGRPVCTAVSARWRRPGLRVRCLSQLPAWSSAGPGTASGDGRESRRVSGWATDLKPHG